MNMKNLPYAWRESSWMDFSLPWTSQLIMSTIFIVLVDTICSPGSSCLWDQGTLSFGPVTSGLNFITKTTSIYGFLKLPTRDEGSNGLAMLVDCPTQLTLIFMLLNSHLSADQYVSWQIWWKPSREIIWSARPLPLMSSWAKDRIARSEALVLVVKAY